MTAAYRLGVDFGTSTTVAMLQQPDGRIRPLLFDGSPLLSSAVLLGSDGKLHTGRDAAHLARGNPEGLEPNPKRRIDDGTVLLGAAEVRVRDLVAAVFERVATEARQVGGGAGESVLTHPADWGPGRRRLLAQTAGQAGLGRAHLVSEPVAAATYLVHARAATLPPGSSVLIYDLGAGTCDVTLLRREPHGFDPIATDGLNDVGGLDVDAAIVAFLQATYGDLWTDGASRRQVWDEVRTGKEMLSRTAATIIAVPTLGKQVPLGREQLDMLARPVLRPTVAMAQSLCREAGIDPRAVAGLFLVGGASRIPLVATMLHEALGVAPVATDQPELVVAEGALHALSGTPFGSAAPASPAPLPLPMDVSGAMSPPVSGGPFPVSPAAPALTSNPSPVSPAAPPLGGGPAPGGPSRRHPPRGRPSRSQPARPAAAAISGSASASGCSPHWSRWCCWSAGPSPSPAGSTPPARTPTAEAACTRASTSPSTCRPRSGFPWTRCPTTCA
jgi:actin-like ATPase involved in cell morphogenesis